MSSIFTKENAQEYLKAGDTFYIDAVRYFFIVDLGIVVWMFQKGI